MNTDNILENQQIRQTNFQNKINSRLVKCSDVNKYANKQNTIYDKNDNTMLYGINNKMHPFGVSDGTCNQLDQLLLTNKHICGAGVAGGNPCYHKLHNKIPTYGLEGFSSESTNGIKITENIILLILVVLIIYFLIAKNKK